MDQCVQRYRSCKNQSGGVAYLYLPSPFLVVEHIFLLVRNFEYGFDGFLCVDVVSTIEFLVP